jgi:hypothetical protein
MEICTKIHNQHLDLEEQKQNEMREVTQDAFVHGDKAKCDRKQSNKLNAILLRARAPFQRGSYTDETECRRHRVAPISNNRDLSRNGDPPARPREEPDVKCFNQKIDMNKVLLNLI